MKKIERLSGIIYALQEHDKISATKLAELFEVSERTIYRDIDALCQLQVPIIAYEGAGGGYSIDNNYFIPSLKVNSKELLYLLICLRVGGLLKVPNMKSNFELLNLKLLNSLDTLDKHKYQQLLERMIFFVNDVRPESYCDELFPKLLQSFLDYKQVIINYYSPGSELTKRQITPYIITFYNGGWYLHAYCHLRQGLRIFRLDRIFDISITNDIYSQHDVDSYLQTLTNLDNAVSLKMSISRQLNDIYKDSLYFAHTVREKQDGKNLIISITTTMPDYFVNFAIKNYQHATIMEPLSLINKIREICQGVLIKY